MGFSKATGANSYFTDDALGSVGPYPEEASTRDYNNMIRLQPAGGRKESVKNSPHSASTETEVSGSGRSSGMLVSPHSRGRSGRPV